MRVLLLVVLAVGGLATVRAAAQSASQHVYFTYFAEQANPSTGKKDCSLGFLLPDEAQFRMTLHMKDGKATIDFSYDATKYSDLILAAQAPATENVRVTMLWPNTGDQKTVQARAYLLPASNAVDQNFSTDTVSSSLLYELANSGSAVSIRFSGSHGAYDTSLPQKGLNGLQKFTANCL